jgi:hypothetical protein
MKARIAVIIPLEYHRGLAIACIRGWTQEQDYPREHYQILLGVPAKFDADELAQIRLLLQPWDQAVMCRQDHDMALIENVAALADTELLLFSESHCIPHSDALSYLVNVANTHPEWDAFSAPTEGMTHNVLSRIECSIYSQDIRGKLSSHTWLRVLDQCFVIRQTTYRQIGGFRGEFGHFAEWLFAAAMKVGQFELGVAKRAVVEHSYIGDYNDLAEFTLNFARGQIHCLDRCGHEPAAALLPAIPELDDVKRRTPEERARMFRFARHDAGALLLTALRQALHGHSLEPLWAYRQWLAESSGNAAHLHKLAMRKTDKVRAALERAISQNRQDDARARFVEWFACLVKQGRYDYLTEQSRSTCPDVTITIQPTPAGEWLPETECPGIRLFNIHDAEGTDAGTIRWSLPCLQFFLMLPADGRYCISLHWSPARPLHRTELLSVRLNGSKLNMIDFRFGKYRSR